MWSAQGNARSELASRMVITRRGGPRRACHVPSAWLESRFGRKPNNLSRGDELTFGSHSMGENHGSEVS